MTGLTAMSDRDPPNADKCPVSAAAFHRLKAATRDLVDLCGGVERAAKIARMGSSHISRCKTSDNKDVLGIAAVVALEADCGQPVVTSVMADLAGRRLAEPAEEIPAGAAVSSGHAEAVQKMAAVMTAAAEAFADNKLTPTEAELVDRKYGELEAYVAKVRHDLARAKGPRVVKG